MGQFKSYVWLTCHPEMNLNEWKEKFKQAKANGLYGIFLSKSVPEQIIEAANEAGLETHVWLMIMCRPDVYREQDTPDWFMVNRNGISCTEEPAYVDYYRWLCPNHPEVIPFLKNQLESLAATTDAKGIHLDYIRYPDIILPIGLQPKYNLKQTYEMPEFDYCYCPNCQAAFKQQYGRDILDVQHPESDRDWRQFRLDSITKVVKELELVVRKHNKLITAAVFPTPENARNTVRQDWVNWNLDALYPMLYHDFYEETIEWIANGVTLGLDETRCKVPIYAGIYLQDMSPLDLKQAIELVKSKYGSGISIFNWNEIHPEHWKIIKESNE